jgi:O-antigen/teichoic acid export membrane protein
VEGADHQIEASPNPSRFRTARDRISSVLRANTVRDTAIYVAVNAIAAFVPFLILPILTRALSAEEYGLFAMAMASLGLLFPLASLGLPNLIARDFVHGAEIDFPVLVTTCMALSAAALLGLAVALELLAVFVPAVLYYVFGGLPRSLLPALHGMVAGQIMLAIGLTLLQMQGRPFVYGAVRMAHATAFAVAGILTVLPFNGGGNGLVLAKALVDLALVVCVVWWMARCQYLVARFSVAEARRALAYGLPLVPHILAIGFIPMIDRLLLTMLIGVHAAGVYMVGYQIGMIMWLIVNSMNQAWIPWFYREMKHGTDDAKRRIVAATYVFVLTLAILAVVFALAVPTIVALMAGPDFQDARAVAPWIVLAFFFQGFYMLSSAYLYYQGHTGSLAASMVVTATVHLGMSWFLISRNGMVGAAQGAAVAYAVASILIATVAIRSMPMPWFRALGRLAGRP